MMDKKTIAEISAAVRALKAAGFTSISEASVFLAAATADANGVDVDLTLLVERTELPFSSVSRIAWGLHERGLFSYENHQTDRRRRLVRPNLPNLRALKELDR